MDGIQMGFFDLVKQQDAVGILLNKTGQRAGLCSLVAALKTYEARVGLMVGKA